MNKIYIIVADCRNRFVEIAKRYSQDENVIDDLRDIAIRIVDELVDEGYIKGFEFGVQDIIHNKLIHNLADMDSPVIKEYIGE